MFEVEGLKLVELEIDKVLKSEVKVLEKASEHIVHSGGKRIRPALVLLANQACFGEDLKKTIPLAASVELIHTATLVHDDINDGSKLRRGSPTVNSIWGKRVALLTGDFIFTKLFDLLSSYDRRIIEALVSTCTKIAEGETLQLMNLGRFDLSEKLYLKIVSKKTAALFSVCTEIGALLADAEKTLVSILKIYGYNLGMAFQITDDLLDLVGEESELGKPIENDLKQKKPSIATIHALKNGATLDEIFSTPRKTLKVTGSLTHSKKKAREFSERAKKSLQVLEDSDAKERLLKLSDFVVSRRS
ncbi:MAG: polyprenyl synthetase family protein [Candidatus Methanofastidiosia archaeon]